MKKNSFLLWSSGLVFGVILMIQPSLAKGEELNTNSLKDDIEFSTLAMQTGVTISSPGAIYGARSTADITLNFSGDKNGSNQYRYTFNTGKGVTRNGATSATRQSFRESYAIGGLSRTWNISATAAGYSSASASAQIRQFSR